MPHKLLLYMKQFIFGLIALFFTLGAQAQEVVFYFPAQASSLSEAQVDSIETLVNAGAEIDSIIGVANTLRNTRTGEANPTLALKRAEAVNEVAAKNAPIGAKVIRSAQASDRRVEIYISNWEELHTPNNNETTSAEEEGGFIGQDQSSGLGQNNSSGNTTDGGVAGETAELEDSASIELPDTLTLPTIGIELEITNPIAVAPKVCDCGADMDRYQALMFYHEVLDSSLVVLKHAKQARGDSARALRQHFRFLRDKAQGVLNCVKKSRKEASEAAAIAGEKPPVFIRNYSKKHLLRLGGNPPCDAGEVETEVRKTSKKYHAYKQKRGKKRFSFRFKRKPKRFKHSFWLALASRLACGAK